MSYLIKEQTLIARDEQGNVIPTKVKLELLPEQPEIDATPLLKGELQRMFRKDADTKNIDDEIILNHCVNPKYTQEDLEFMKPEIYGAITTAILSVSLNVSQQEIKKRTEKKVAEEALAQQNFT